MPSTLPEGQIITAADGVQSRLEELLSLKQGTWEHVLFARQTVLPQTLQQIAGESSVRDDLAQQLRKAVFEIDGVPIEQLGVLISERLASSSSRWDCHLRRSENNHGIENR